MTTIANDYAAIRARLRTLRRFATCDLGSESAAAVAAKPATLDDTRRASAETARRLYYLRKLRNRRRR